MGGHHATQQIYLIKMIFILFKIGFNFIYKPINNNYEIQSQNEIIYYG